MRRRDVPRDAGAVVGCYDLHLYCQHPKHTEDWCASNYEVPDSPGEFAGLTYADALKQARNKGWWVSRKDNRGDYAVLCPYHNKQVRP